MFLFSPFHQYKEVIIIFFSVEKLATLCKVDRETIRRWRNRGVNGIKLEARQSASQRGAALIFDEAAVRAFMEANPKYVTKELDEALNPSSEPTSVEYNAFSGQAAVLEMAMSNKCSNNREMTCSKSSTK